MHRFLICVVISMAWLRPTDSIAEEMFAPLHLVQTDVATQAANALFEGVVVEKLENGLQFVLKPVPGAGVVTTMVMYKVGSSDEELTQTGLSHYLEHLMFKGTEKLHPGDIDRISLRNGGSNNAYTTEDVTGYHFDFAADRWERALEIEADRMRNIRIDAAHEFNQEKGAVIEELRRNEDEPWDIELKTILPLLFGSQSPYGHPVIGLAEHVRGATAEVIKSHYDKWYHPNNAVLVICGEFDPEKTRAKIKSLFGPIPAGKLPARKVVTEFKSNRPQQITVPSKFELPRLLVGYNTVEGAHPDVYALDILQGILSGGKASRLYSSLVEGKEVAVNVSASSSVGRYPGWFSLQVEMLGDKKIEDIESMLLEQIEKLKNEPVTAQELSRVKRSMVATAIFTRESCHELANSIASGIAVHDLDYLREYLPKLLAVTPADIQNVARKYLDPQKRISVWSVPKPGAKMERGPEAPKSPKSKIRRMAENRAQLSPIQTGFSLPLAKKHVLPNGLTLLLLENHRLPIFVAEAQCKYVSLLEPKDKSGVAALTGSMLSEGTTKHTGPQISELIEDVGGSLNLQASGGSVQVLSSDRKLGLELLFECLSKANFPNDAFRREKEQQLAEIDDSDKRPEVRAFNTFHQMAYGEHPWSRPANGYRSTVEKLTVEDCKAFYNRLFVPNNTVVAVVGDFDSAKIIEEITELTKDWKQGNVARPTMPDVVKPKSFVTNTIPMKDAAQLHFLLGHVGIKRNNPDYYKLLVMDYVLGTGPGFTDRLSARLRDREGLAYTVSANITSSAGDEPGLFSCYIGTEAKNYDKVKSMFLEEIQRIRKTPPDLQEVEDAKMYLLGSLPFRFTSSEMVAGQLLSIERYELGLNYLETFRREVGKVTPQDIRDVAAKYLDPEHMLVVAAGPLEEKKE